MTDEDDTFDLNIENYNTQELQNLLHIEGDVLTIEEIDNATFEMIDQLHESEQAQYITFFNQVRDELINTIALHNLSRSPSPNIIQYEERTVDQPRFDLLRTPHINNPEHHSVVSQNVMPTNDVFVNPFPVGTLNPIRRRVTTQLVSIDTLFRQNYDITTSSNFMYSFPTILNSVISMRLSAIELPNVWYTFSTKKRNNEFTITTNNAPGLPDKLHKIIIPDGNYTGPELEDVINNLFNTNTQGLQYLHFTIDPYTAKSVIRARDATVDTVPPGNYPYAAFTIFEFILDFRLQDMLERPINRNVGWTLGFRKDLVVVTHDDIHLNNIDYNPPVTFHGYTECLGIFSSSIPQYLFLAIDDFNKSASTSILSSNHQSFLSDNILGRLNISSGSNTVIMDNGFDQIFKKREYFGPVKLTKLRIRLLDKFGDVIDINNSDFSFALEFTQLYS